MPRGTLRLVSLCGVCVAACAQEPVPASDLDAGARQAVDAWQPDAAVDDGPDAGEVRFSGSISINQYIFPVAPGRFALSGFSYASFLRSTFTASGLAFTCDGGSLGSCWHRSCSPIDGGPLVPTTPDGSVTYLSAGIISLRGTGGEVFMVPPEYSGTIPAGAFPGGTVVTASATGDEIPGFEGLSLMMPSPIVLTVPACQATNCGSIDRSMPLSVSWSAGGVGSVTVNIRAGQDLLDCVYPIEAGTALIPAEMVRLLPASARALVGLSSSTRTSVDAGGFTLWFRASTQASYEVELR